MHHEVGAAVHARKLSNRNEDSVWRRIVQQEARAERGWKLFTLLPRMLLHRPLSMSSVQTRAFSSYECSVALIGAR